MIATSLSVLFACAACAGLAVIAASLRQHGPALLAARQAWLDCPESLTVRFELREVKAPQRHQPIGAKVLVLPVRRSVQMAPLPDRLAA